MPDNQFSSELVRVADKDEVLNLAKEVYSAVAAVYDDIKNDRLSVGMRYNCLGIANRRLAALGAALGRAEDVVQEQAHKLNLLREANTEIARLRGQLAAGVTPDSVSAKLEALNNAVRDWWRPFSFGSMTGRFLPRWGGAEFLATFRVGGYEGSESVQAGCDTVAADGDVHIVDSDKTRQYLTGLFTTRFPGSKIQRWESRGVHAGDGRLAQPWEIEVVIPLGAI